jgi:hypothetical protein
MRNFFAAIELRVNDYSSVIRKSLRGQAIGQIGCFARRGTCVRAALRVKRTRQFRLSWRGPGEARLLPLSPLRRSAAPRLSRSRHLLAREKSTLALRDGPPGRWWDAIEWKAWLFGTVWMMHFAINPIKIAACEKSQVAIDGGGGNCTRVPRSFDNGLYVRSRSFECQPRGPDRQGPLRLIPS